MSWPVLVSGHSQAVEPAKIRDWTFATSTDDPERGMGKATFFFTHSSITDGCCSKRGAVFSLRNLGLAVYLKDGGVAYLLK